jgi:hypothetical protein
MAQEKAAMAAIAMRGSVVRVVVPADVSYNLDRFQKTLANLAERLGCKPCLSGAACQFLLEKDFLVDPAGRVSPIEMETGIGG